MSHLITQEPPQPHRKKKQKRRAASVSSDANAPRHLIHHATVGCQEMPKPDRGEATVGGDAFRFGELRQRSVNGRDSSSDSAVTAADDAHVKEVASVGAATSPAEESFKLKRVLENDFTSYRCWFLCLLGFISVTINGHANEDSDDHLEASENEVHHLSSIFFSYSSLMSVECACGTEDLDDGLILHYLLNWEFKRPSTIELSDFGCFLIMACGVTVLQQIVQAITLSACIVAHYNALPALLVSNNFAEIKSYVFKGYSKDNVHSMVYSDSIERFHISAFVLFVLAQNILEAEGPWFESFLINILLVYLFEMAIDVIKHSFIAKFNNIAPIAYSEFLEVLCKQTLNMQTEGAKKKLTFVPLSPACVVIRVLTPVYAANLPYNSLPWRLSGILLFSALTYIMLTSLKVLSGMVLQKLARWYVNRCQRRKKEEAASSC
ncbi:hypothetical protein Fmac_005264 [Flemingia macrophylla]|uniref:Protein POLLEN DEFECTIVE IN GUIDANCE 1 n=1 Tax=Flemingia macrophylla TaxID=520843 RepID=A0ABD1N7F3_9FABA